MTTVPAAPTRVWPPVPGPGGWHMPDRHDALTALSLLDHRLTRTRWAFIAREPVHLDGLRVDFSRALHVIVGFGRLQLPDPPQVALPRAPRRQDVLGALGALDRAVFYTRCAVHRRDPEPSLPGLCRAYETAAGTFARFFALPEPVAAAASSPDAATATTPPSTVPPPTTER